MKNELVDCWKIVLSTLITILLASCGGGGGANGNGEAQASVSPDSYGYMYYADDAVIYRQEVATGTVHVHVQTDFRFPESASASDDSTLFSVFDHNYSTLDIISAESRLVARLNALEGQAFSQPVEFSPNKFYFMVYRYGDFERTKDFFQLEIYGSNGLKSSLRYRISGYDWLSNEEIVFSVGDSIYRQKLVGDAQVLGEPELVYQFPGEAIWDVSVSPDGQQLAVIVRGVTVHVVGLSGGGDRHVASLLSNKDGEITGLNAVRWSPDGTALAVATRALTVSYIAQGCSFISTFPAFPASLVDIGNRDTWISKNRDGQGDWYYTCVGDLHSFSWRAQ